MTRLFTCLAICLLAYPVAAVEDPPEPAEQLDTEIQLDAQTVRALKAGEAVLVEVKTPDGQTVSLRLTSNKESRIPAAATGASEETRAAVPSTPPLPDATVVVLPPEPIVVVQQEEPLTALPLAAADTASIRDSEFSLPAPPRPDEELVTEVVETDYVLPPLIASPADGSTEITQQELEGTSRIPFDSGQAQPAAEELAPYVPSQFPLSEPAEDHTAAAPLFPTDASARTAIDEVQAGFASGPGAEDKPAITPIQPATLTPLGKPVADTSRPWLPLVLATMALLASVGGNIYLGYLCAGFYRRNRTLLDDSVERSSPALEGDASTMASSANDQSVA